ncbi:MAG: transposase [Lachnospiraceae bacterium]|nr:transposase [Lachnospiraceae bacterium]
MGRKSDYSNDMYKQLQEIMGRLDSVEKDLKTEKHEHKKDVDRLNDKINSLEKTIEEKDREIEVLTNDNERLKRIINNDSSNSSLPPSTDQRGKKANTYNGREKSEKKAGAQKGHKGVTLTKQDAEEKLRSGRFEHKIENIGTSEGKYITKYVMDLEVIPVIREIRIYADSDGRFHVPEEYRSDVTYGSKIKTMAVDLYSEGVMSNERICAFLNTISGNTLELSAGSVYGFCKSFSEKCVPSLNQIEEELLNEKNVCTDATVVTVNGKQAYIRNTSSEKAVLYHAMENKSIEALDAIEFLTKYAGTLTHDHETALYHYGTKHGECNVHLLRYLKKNTEEALNHWSSELAAYLCKMNDDRKERIKKGITFTEEELAAYEKRYDEIIAEGKIQNKHTKGRLAKQEEKTLLTRLEKYKKNHLLFLYDFSVPFENNMSERDLRKCKNRQKMSGGFRKQSGNEMYCAIMSIIETCKRKKMQVIENIKRIFDGTPAIF